MKIYNTSIIAILSLFLFSCSETTTDNTETGASKLIILSGQVTNPNSDSLTIQDHKGAPVAYLVLDEEGKFIDTLEVDNGKYMFFDGAEFGSIYLEKGFNLDLRLDAKMFDESIEFSGEGSVQNNSLASFSLKNEEMWMTKIDELDSTAFQDFVDSKRTELSNVIDESKIPDTAITNGMKRELDGNLSFLASFYEAAIAIKKMEGTSLKDYSFIDVNDKEVSISNFAGKNLYIDVWATWCTPCKNEIPYLKEVEEHFHGKNIEFISISVDEDKDKNKWKNMVADMELGGTQLIVTDNWSSEFAMDLKINSIPRFLIIDSNGIIVKGDAIRPSNPEINSVLSELLGE